MDCDVMAIRGKEEPVVVELKLSFNLGVILQAVERLSLSDTVYVGVPSTLKALKRQRKQITKMMRMLGIGLIAINPDKEASDVKVLLDPGEYKPRQSKPRKGRLLGEFAQRVGDPNLGGSAKQKGVITAYRQRAIAIASYLQNEGPTKASVIATALDEPKARDLMYKNFYGWFDRTSKGIYELSPRGSDELQLWLEKHLN